MRIAEHPHAPGYNGHAYRARRIAIASGRHVGVFGYVLDAEPRRRILADIATHRPLFATRPEPGERRWRILRWMGDPKQCRFEHRPDETLF